MYTKEDLLVLQQKGITEALIESQLNCFKTGFPYLELSGAASYTEGIEKLSPEEEEEVLNNWNNYCNNNHRIVKFVPASGAASRMFKNLFEFLDAPYDTPQIAFEQNFFTHIDQFAFFDQLNQCCKEKAKADIPTLIKAGNFKTVVKYLLSAEGLNYGNLPKGLLKFHQYPSADARTPLEEHLVEGALYAQSNRQVTIHFTVSPEHRLLFEALAQEKKAYYESLFNVQFEVTFSEQKSSTDTIAADMDNQPFRDNGKLVFRPGGHGALIENLNDLDSDIVFIKNIDNVVPDSYKESTVRYKKVLAGLLVTLQQQVFDYLKLLESGQYSQEQLIEIIQFLQRKLHTRHQEIKQMEDSELAVYLIKKLNRPIRVCGMVKNEGEPGGGPFLAVNPDKTISLQILESSQIDMSDPEKKNV